MRIARILLIFLITTLPLLVLAPPNCELYKSDNLCYNACNDAWSAIRKKQGSKASQDYFNEAIAQCPTLDYAYMEKAVPYLKRGLFIEWKNLIDKAVSLAPGKYLGYRASCIFQFLKDYKLALNDIHAYRKFLKGDIGYCQNGDYHLDIVEFLCYKELGLTDSARACMNKFLKHKSQFIAPYDYYHFGVFEYEQSNYQQAIHYFEKQLANNDYMSETYYYLALAHNTIGELELAVEYKTKALNHYQKGYYRRDTYTEPVDKVYLKQIESLTLKSDLI